MDYVLVGVQIGITCTAAAIGGIGATAAPTGSAGAAVDDVLAAAEVLNEVQQ